jgi:hypothetical protein
VVAGSIAFSALLHEGKRLAAWQVALAQWSVALYVAGTVLDPDIWRDVATIRRAEPLDRRSRTRLGNAALSLLLLGVGVAGFVLPAMGHLASSVSYPFDLVVGVAATAAFYGLQVKSPATLRALVLPGLALAYAGFAVLAAPLYLSGSGY